MYNLSGVALLLFLRVFRAFSLGQMPHTCMVRAMQNDINGSQHVPNSKNESFSYRIEIRFKMGRKVEKKAVYLPHKQKAINLQ